MSAQLQNQAASVVRMNPRGLGNVVRDIFYQFTSNLFTFTLGSENLQQSIPIGSDSHFLWVSAAYTNTAEVGNATATTATPYRSVSNGGALVQLTDGASQRQLSNFGVPVSSLFGDGRLPHVLEFTHLFRANSSIGISITGMGAAAPFAGQAIRLTFSGFKVPLDAIPAGGL